MKFVLSPVGTSILTNKADENLRKILRDTANKTEEELTPEEKTAIDNQVRKAESCLRTCEKGDLKKISAEINGILSCSVPEKGDYHVLLASDTYQGQCTAGLIKEFLFSKYGCSVEPLIPQNLSTRDKASFTSAMTEVAEWCENTIPGYRQSGYQILFNLTGGFKSVLGFLNTLGMLYADEIVYIFESENSDLLTIPQLPIKMDPTLAKENAVALSILYGHDTVPVNGISLNGLPASMYETIKENGIRYVELNTWGTVIWQKGRKEALGGKLLDWPFMEYEASFRKDFENIKDPTQRVDVQGALSNVAYLLLTNDGDLAALRKDGGLLYEDLKQVKGVGHFRVNNGTRISCMKKGKTLILRHVGSHNYVNDNP